jgi:hypothetical protein
MRAHNFESALLDPLVVSESSNGGISANFGHLHQGFERQRFATIGQH